MHFAHGVLTDDCGNNGAMDGCEGSGLTQQMKGEWSLMGGCSGTLTDKQGTTIQVPQKCNHPIIIRPMFVGQNMRLIRFLYMQLSDSLWRKTPRGQR